MQRWSTAMAEALYGRHGFYTAGRGPAAHFRTSVTASAVLAEALAGWLPAVDAELGHPERFDMVDVGAGNGRLLGDLAHALRRDARGHGLAARVHWVGVDVTARPSDVDPDVSWSHDVPDRVVGLVVAHELLDNVPVDVVQLDEQLRWREVLVDVDGREQLGDPASGRAADWLAHWWSLRDPEPGDRAEVGVLRDQMWGRLVRALDRGVGLAVDFAHTRHERAAGAWSSGSLRAYRDGRQVPLVLDGSCDVTAHVALDACAAAGAGAGAGETLVLEQREALRRLGVRAERPDLGLATSAPHDYLRALQHVGEVGELLDPHGLGGFGWLLQAKGCMLPPLQRPG